MTADSSFFGIARPINKCLELAIFQKSPCEDIVYERLLTKSVLMELKDNELNLNDGRFVKFNRFEKYNREVKLGIKPHKFVEKIDWISEYTNHQWSITALPKPEMFSDNTWNGTFTMDCIFHFENKIDAGYFAIRWR